MLRCWISERNVKMSLVRRHLQPPGLEKVVVMLHQGILIRFFAKWNAEPPIFVDLRQLLDHVVVKSVEANEQCSDTWRLAQNSRLRKCVGLEHSILESSNGRLLGFIVAVKRSKVQVRRGYNFVPIFIIGAKDIMDDDGS